MKAKNGQTGRANLPSGVNLFVLYQCLSHASTRPAEQTGASIHVDGAKYSVHEHARAQEARGAREQRQPEAEHRRVAKVKGHLRPLRMCNSK